MLDRLDFDSLVICFCFFHSVPEARKRPEHRRIPSRIYSKQKYIVSKGRDNEFSLL